jgi:hypothetical protein
MPQGVQINTPPLFIHKWNVCGRQVSFDKVNS